MKKLNEKHLITYLPYAVLYKRGNNKPLILRRYDDWFKLRNVKLILHPLSDLTKEIEVNGKKFVPLTRILATGEVFWELNKSDSSMLSYFIRKDDNLLKNPYWVLELLFEWHFDVFKLIPEGLAIDINTL